MTQPVDHTSAASLVILRANACSWLLTNLGGVICGSKNELRGAVVPGADVGDVGLVFDQNLGAAKIAQLEHTGRGVQEEVLGLDVPVADALRVDIGEGAEKLVDVELDLEDGHDSLHLVEVARGAVDGLGNEFEDKIQVHLVLLWLKRLAARNGSVGGDCRHIPARRCCRRRL